VSVRILVVRRTEWPPLPEAGAWARSDGNWPRQWTWLPRAEAETDERFLQIIPYALLRNDRGEIWCYARNAGDPRLKDRLSAGVGGHVETVDAAASIEAMAESALRRELREEILWQPKAAALQPVAWIYEGLSAIGRVHLGMLYVLSWPEHEPPRPADGQGLKGIGFVPAERVADDPRFELWSRLAAGFFIQNSA
jgi:predicted NUDIX family phosphoesterase